MPSKSSRTQLNYFPIFFSKYFDLKWPFQTIWIENQAPRNVGPDLRPILFETRHQILLRTVYFAWDDLSSDYIQICQFYKLFKNFWRALYNVETVSCLLCLVDWFVFICHDVDLTRFEFLQNAIVFLTSCLRIYLIFTHGDFLFNKRAHPYLPLVYVWRSCESSYAPPPDTDGGGHIAISICLSVSLCVCMFVTILAILR